VQVFLIHGMGRTSLSLAWLARRLRQAGHEPSSFGYLVHRDSLEVIAAAWATHIRDRATSEGYAVIGHSLGNVITRMALPHLVGLTHFVMLAPPNRVPVMATTFAPSPIFRAVTGDAGLKLRDPQFFASLTKPPTKTLIVAGSGGPRSSWLPFRGEVNDGVVAMSESALPGVPMVTVPAVHTLIMNHAQTIERTLAFLRS
jgi:pimeloyl-ACP methyl ester carboxylesterase